MRVLVVGSGGREHALVWKIAQSKLVDKIFCAPGNGGIAKLAECVEISTEDIEGLMNFAKKEKIDLTVVGPEAPLAKGIVDEFENYKLKIFGPNKEAAQIEASKIFAKQLMKKYDIPTADFEIFDSSSAAKKYVEKKGIPCVIKADGLAGGKGVIVAKTFKEAQDAISVMMEDKIFGKAAERIIIEDYLEGQEASIIVITDSKKVIPFLTSQDHKRIFDDDKGANTGGMGAYSPTPIITRELFDEILKKIIYKIINALAKEGFLYKGALYAGIILTKDGPKVLEFNARFGDPEIQVILPLLNSDLFEAMLAVAYNNLSKFLNYGILQWDKRTCVCVVCAARGYPGNYEKDKEIFGLDEVSKMKDIFVFHAGTKIKKEAGKIKYLTNGGRVLGITGLGINLKDAIDKTYEAVKKIHFEGMHYRKDIGQKALKFLN
ncbi:MAG: phosphoribosylamine--glycine ligase [Candidatus Omnitrophica bacterium]|nr:phosphoribosylamine--glycine ligase [Candidatus Omnitrophota bacterium]